MINSNFFIENKEVIGLWIILALIGLILFEFITDYIEKTLRKRKSIKVKEQNLKQAIYKDAMLWRKQQREIEYKEFRKKFKKSYLEIIQNF